MQYKREAVTKGIVSPVREVPAHIPRPEYIGKSRVSPYRESEINPPDVITRVRQAARIAAQALAKVGEAVQPGITTDELDRIGHEFLIANNAYPSTLGYPGAAGRPPFPKSVCTSVNEVICHGIPDSTVLQDGDIVSVDITAYIDGVHGDNCATFVVGAASPEVQALVDAAEQATSRGIKAAQVGREINVIGTVIEKFARRRGYESVRDYTGHGVGRAFHSGLIIPHYDAPGLYREVITPGMIFTVEPMLVMGSQDNFEWPDRWTVATKDGSWVAQFEHTILITESGPEVLTKP